MSTCLNEYVWNKWLLSLLVHTWLFFPEKVRKLIIRNNFILYTYDPLFVCVNMYCIFLVGKESFGDSCVSAMKWIFPMYLANCPLDFKESVQTLQSVERSFYMTQTVGASMLRMCTFCVLTAKKSAPLSLSLLLLALSFSLFLFVLPFRSKWSELVRYFCFWQWNWDEKKKQHTIWSDKQTTNYVLFKFRPLKQ